MSKRYVRKWALADNLINGIGPVVGSRWIAVQDGQKLRDVVGRAQAPLPVRFKVDAHRTERGIFVQYARVVLARQHRKVAYPTVALNVRYWAIADIRGQADVPRNQRQRGTR